ncbi:Putative Dodecaheme cytochrome c [Nitrospina watsonii]|uniref:Dodecaheme cytochrome c n=1 Tax=Nitrospina watsonii TaxID=1323948 RepID=A0ABM9HGE7_9BACT|nr:Putative Dodecaheme cytochrome c [Nitrospina watsonii]
MGSSVNKFGLFILMIACTAIGLPALDGTASDKPVLQPAAWQPSFQSTASDPEHCLQCHNGIEPASASHPLKMGCTACHGGDASAVTKENAHATLIHDADAGTGKRNPSSLKVVHLSCGQAQCHSGFADDSRNWADHVRKSPMGTLAGMIAGLRFQWSGQTGKDAKFGIYAVDDADGNTPKEKGAVERLSRLPYFSKKTVPRHQPDAQDGERVMLSNHFADHLLRDRCFQCHLDAAPPEGVYRSQGCAACHFAYNEQGLYEGNDPTIPKQEPGHAATHTMTVLPPQTLCTQCHRQFETEAPLASATFTATGQQFRFAGTGQPVEDVHRKAGMECIDCHTAFDVMGDGNIYSRQHQAVEVRCETCHGTETAYPETAVIQEKTDPAVRLSRHYPGFQNKVGDEMVLTAHGNKMSNVKKIGKRFVFFSKRSDKQIAIPQAAWKRQTHTLSGHTNKLQCTSCHAQWVPQCQGCHITYDAAAYAQGRNPWGSGPRQHTAWQAPRLMQGPRGKIAPFLEQPPRTLTVLDAQGHPLPVINEEGDREGDYKEWQFTNALGYSGSNLVYAAQPHSVQKTVRSCAGCHLSPETLGLGEGELKLQGDASGEDDEYNFLVLTDIKTLRSELGPKATVTLRGQPVAGSGQPGARPLNQSEILRMLRVGNCIPCHDAYDDPVYQNMSKSYQFEKQGRHRKLREKILKQR